MMMTVTKMINTYPADEKQQSLYKNFPSTHFLSNPTNVLNSMAWCTFWRRNLHRFAMDYLKISLYEYQQMSLYEMGNASSICIIASRNDAKSFLIALYACCRAILYPGSKVVIGSATRGQSKLIVTEKIQNELMEWSEPLRREIKDVKTNGQEVSVKFNNTSTIIVFTANDNARGLRSHVAIREEFRQIKKEIEDKVISPFQTPRNRPYMRNSFYKNISVLEEEPVDIYISSSWQDATHWMWNIVDMNYKEMLKDNGSILLAFDESLALKHKLKTKKQLIKEKKKQDPTTWKVEFLNLRVKDSETAYYTYSMLMKCQRLKQVFYPRKSIDVKFNKKNKYYIPKQDGEVRAVSCDIAFVSGEQNDNSVYSCIRGIPEIMTYDNDNSSIEVKHGYRKKYPYIESNQIGDTVKQAIRIRQLYEDFNADYIVLDCRNGGTQILYTLQKVLYDEERGIEYPPLKCMNNDEYAKVCQDPFAKECIFAINATQNINSDIAINFRQNLVENRVDFLVNSEVAKEEILDSNQDYKNAISTDDTTEQVDFEKPFLETQALISECAELQYEKLPQTGAIKVYEHGSNRKDRYTSCSYGAYFLDKLALDLLGSSDDYDYTTLIN